MTTQFNQQRKKKRKMSQETKQAALTAAFAAIDAALATTKPKTKKGKFVKGAVQGALALFPRKNDPAWYLRRGVIQSGINMSVPSVTANGIYSSNDRACGRTDAVATVANVLPPGDIWDTQMAAMMAKLRSNTGATQLYGVDDLKYYFALVREAWSCGCALRAICRAPLVSDKYDTRAAYRYMDEMGGILGITDREALLKHMPVLRSNVAQLLSALMPYVPKGLPFFERPAFLFSNAFKDQPSAKFNGIVFQYRPSAVGRIRNIGAEAGQADSWAVDDYVFEDDSNPPQTVRPWICTSLASVVSPINQGFTASDLVVSSAWWWRSGAPSTIGIATGLPGNGQTIGETLLAQMVRKIVASDVFALIRGDLDRTYGCYAPTVDLQMNSPLPVIYDELLCQQFHNASINTASSGGMTGAQQYCFHNGAVSRDAATGGVHTGPAWITLDGGSTGQEAALCAPDCNVNSSTTGRYVSKTRLGGETNGVSEAGLIPTGSLSAFRYQDVPLIVDSFRIDPTPGELMEIVRWKTALSERNFAAANLDASGTGSLRYGGTMEFEACGTDVITDIKYVYAYAPNQSLLAFSPAVSSTAVRMPSAYICCSKIECSPLNTQLALDNNNWVWSIAGPQFNQAPIGHSALKMVLDQGSLSMLEP